MDIYQQKEVKKLSRVSFIHAADLHLDSPFIGLMHLPNSILTRIQESTFTSFKKIIDYAILKKVDFIVIAGDLYDSKQRSLKAQIRFRNEMQRLERSRIQAFIIHGNHDPLNGSWVELEWPSNVHFFKDKVEAIPYYKENQLTAYIYGFSYPTRDVTVNMAMKYERKQEDCLHIGLLHGTVSSNTEHIPYAPFQVNELIQKDFDYWALGHIHQKQMLSQVPPVVYSGNIQGRHKKEVGPKGCYYVELSKETSELTFWETNDVLWDNVEISINNLTTIDQFLQLCQGRLDEYRKPYQGVLLNLTLTGNGELARLLQDQAVLEDLISNLQEIESEKHDFVYVYDYKNETSLMEDLEKWRKEEHFIGDLLNNIEEYDGFDDAVSPLYQHRQVRKLIEPLTDEEKIKLLKEAQTWMISELLNGVK